MLGGKGFGAWKMLASGSLEQPGRGRPTQVVNRREVAHPRGAVARAMMKLFWRREQKAAVVEAPGPQGARGSCVSHRDGLAGAWESGSVYVTGLCDCVHTHPCTLPAYFLHAYPSTYPVHAHPAHVPLYTHPCTHSAHTPLHMRPCTQTHTPYLCPFRSPLRHSLAQDSGISLNLSEPWFLHLPGGAGALALPLVYLDA